MPRWAEVFWELSRIWSGALGLFASAPYPTVPRYWALLAIHSHSLQQHQGGNAYEQQFGTFDSASRILGRDQNRGTAQLLQEGFQLASFLFPDRSTAIEIVVRALARLRSRSHREMKRLYWRDKHSTHPGRRVARGDADMLHG